MRLERIIRAVFFEPWLIDARAHASIRQLVQAKLSDDIRADALAAINQDENEDLDEPKGPEGIALIPIQGVIGKRVSMIEKVCFGATDVLEVSEAIQGALADDSIKGIFMEFDSPGGTVGGVPELADEIRSAAQVKPIMAYADGMMCSAAYWLASGADAIYATRTAEVGSIGVYIPWVDESASFAMDGLKADPIVSTGSKFKAMGFPGTSLTAEQRAMLQERVDHTLSMFKGAVTARGRKVAATAMLGQTFEGDGARAVGLVDSISTRERALCDLLDMIQRRKK